MADSVVTEELIRALELERASGVLARRWLDAGGRERAVYDILERQVIANDRHGQTLWDLLVDRGVAPPEAPEVETPEDYPEAMIRLKKDLIGLYDRVAGAVSGRERRAIQRLRDEDDDQRALLSVYFPEDAEGLSN